MKILVTLLVFLLTSQVFGKTIRVGVVDTGLDLTDPRLNKHLCDKGHKDFTGEGLTDTVGHGTRIVGLIEKYAGNGDYCLIIYKYYSENVVGLTNIKNEVKAFKKIIKDKVKIVNFSSSGKIFEEEEYLIMKQNPRVIFVVAAGNEGKNLDIPGNEAYPACYYLKNEIVVKNITEDNKIAPTSNYGKNISAAEVGTYIKTTGIIGEGLISGTSASTAIRTGKMIRKMLNATK